MNWTTKWPTENGKYLFYGHTSQFGLKHNKIEFGMLDVHNVSGNPMYVLNGAFAYPREGGIGYFKPIGDVGITDEMTLFLQKAKEKAQA